MTMASTSGSALRGSSVADTSASSMASVAPSSRNAPKLPRPLSTSGAR
jgi:hypothetical protein